MNAKWPHHDSPIYQALGRNHALVIAIDGIRYIEIRPVPHAVNPWRHVATRQKHFHFASHAARDDWNHSFWCDDDNASLIRRDASRDAYEEAHDNCRWGV